MGVIARIFLSVSTAAVANHGCFVGLSPLLTVSLFLCAKGVVSKLSGPDTERLVPLPDRPCPS